MVQKNPLVSIVIPVFNEEQTIITVLDSIKKQTAIKKEVIIVDDGSTDKTALLLKKNKKLYTRLISLSVNSGKGRAIQIGLKKARGKIIIIQDADLEYDPKEYSELIQPIIQDKADVVYGSRFVGSKPHRVMYFWHSQANKFLTFFSNLCTNLNLTDMETGFKAFRAELLYKARLIEKDFGFEPEITAEMVRLRARIFEIGISYYDRTYEEGKKIKLIDFFKANKVIIKKCIENSLYESNQ